MHKPIRACLLYALLAAGLLLHGRPLRADVLATVNGDSITTAMMEQKLESIHLMKAGEMHVGDYDPERLLERMIDDRLMVQEAEAIGLTADSAALSAIEQQRYSLAYRLLLRESVPDTFSATDAETRAAYDSLYEKLDVRSICVADSVLSLQLADSLRHGAGMDELARAHSIDRFKDSSGLATNVVIRTLPVEVRPQLANGPLGDLIGPAHVWGIWALFRVEARRPADSAYFDSVRTDMQDIVITGKRNAYRHAYVESARKDIPVKVDTVQVDSILIRMGLGLEDEDKPVVTVASDLTLSAKSLRAKYIHRISGQSTRPPKTVLYEVLDEQVGVLVLKEVAKRREILTRPEIEPALDSFRDSLLVAAYLEEVVAPTVKVKDEDIASFYEKNRDAYRKPDRYKIASITRATLDEANADYSAATSGTDFAWLARRNSTDDFKEKGGERDWLDASVFPAAIRAELDSLPLGGVAKPTPVDDGYIVMKLLDRKKGEELPLSEVSGRIRSVLVRPMQMKAIDAAVTALRKSADIHVNDEAMKSLQISSPTPESAVKASE